MSTCPDRNSERIKDCVRLCFMFYADRPDESVIGCYCMRGEHGISSIPVTWQPTHSRFYTDRLGYPHPPDVSTILYGDLTVVYDQ